MRSKTNAYSLTSYSDAHSPSNLLLLGCTITRNLAPSVVLPYCCNALLSSFHRPKLPENQVRRVLV